MPSTPPKLPDWTVDSKVIQLRERLAEAESGQRELQDLASKAQRAAEVAQTQATHTRIDVGRGLVTTTTEQHAVDAENRAGEARQARAETERLIANNAPPIAVLRKQLAESEDAARLSAEAALRTAYSAAVQHLNDALVATVLAHEEMRRIFDHAERQFPHRWQSVDGEWHQPEVGLIVQTWNHSELSRENFNLWRSAAQSDRMLAPGNSPIPSSLAQAGVYPQGKTRP